MHVNHMVIHDIMFRCDAKRVVHRVGMPLGFSSCKDKNLVSCTAQHVLSGYRFKQDVSCNSENDSWKHQKVF